MNKKNSHLVYGSRSEVTEAGFCFACHPGVPCFTKCCRNADMYLYPYDIIRLKHRLGMDSEAFLDAHTDTAVRDNPYFPHVMLKMAGAPGKPCPFLSEQGCAVYEDRPFACRAYPLEPALPRDAGDQQTHVFFIVRHPYCQGHEQDRRWAAKQWVDDQKMGPYIENNRQWASVDTLLRRNPWGDKGMDHPALKMVFMACFNVDRFRDFIFNSSFLSRFALSEEAAGELKERDEGLMHFGFDWVRFVLTGEGPLTGLKIS